ncbi:Predicted dehydrogenase [Mariniphaga anaerophila]|uniref:Predicted dehydrogenase n=1 Tax=Mariniphaga anaerophila TaxID=1484053 RepID=A0A1M5A7I1_9BACT|nr:Gfo/Idh/MocA family oxidoreductase [Mariniphaga anaerophila]SHF26268.1 Predicted dehydrogenase [Mariniphaga anaerophila]
MEKNKSTNLNRRKFLSYSALGLTGLTILPSWVMVNGKRIAPSDRVVLGFIGLGRQGLSDFNSFTGCPGVQVAACCDADSLKRIRFKNKVEAWQLTQNVPQRCDMYEFYEDLLARKDIDAVSIASPDHWHALMTIHACEANKDVYVQKPLAFTIREGQEMVKAVRANNRVLQIGSQQRSSEEFQQAIELVRSGAIGHIETIYVKVGDPPKPLDLPEQQVPAGLNWNLWMGPLNDPAIHYHPDLCPPISINPEKDEELWGAWRWYRETGNGYTADWGAHMFDIAQAAIGMDGLGPCEFIPKGYNNTEYLTMKYQNGIIMTEQNWRDGGKRGSRGIGFNGTKGWVNVMRGYIESSDPSLLEKKERKVAEGEYEVSSPHMQNFIDAVRSRKDPIAPVEVGCSTNTLCCLANIATELQRPVKWNPATLSFGDDKEAEAHRLYNYQYRNPYSL